MVDQMSMACSLETCVSLLDKDVVELAFRIPGRLKVAGGETKVLLKRLAARRVARKCVCRPKEGFSVPIKQWLKTDSRPLMEELLTPARLAAEVRAGDDRAAQGRARSRPCQPQPRTVGGHGLPGLAPALGGSRRRRCARSGGWSIP
jgi:asparagine synthetase B (glutamine-hydrolysing)